MNYYLVVEVDADGCWMEEPVTFDTKVDARRYFADQIELHPDRNFELSECTTIKHHFAAEGHDKQEANGQGKNGGE